MNPLKSNRISLGLRLTAAVAGVLAIGWASAGPLLKAGHHDCGVSLVVTPEDRFDPLVQQLLLKQQLSGHPVIDQPRFLVIPYREDGHLTEAQIRYLEQLLHRAGRE